MPVRFFASSHGATRAFVVLVITASTGAGAQGQTGARPAIAPEPAGYDMRIDTDRLSVLTRGGETTAATLAELATRLEESAGRVREVLGAERAPDVRLIVILDGSGLPSGGQARVPHVDRQGRVFLYRYQESREDYLASAEHEIVHAYRRAAGTSYSGFVEEGMAQAIALAVAPGRVAFPRYGYPIPVAAGHLLARGEDIPLRDLRRNNRNLSRRCAIQAYLQRESFFEFLARRFTVEEIIRFVYDGRTSLPKSWLEAFGASFDELADDWRVDLLAAYRAIPEGEALADRYRSESPARFQPFCEPSGAN